MAVHKGLWIGDDGVLSCMVGVLSRAGDEVETFLRSSHRIHTSLLIPST